jgi:hypothetical protein
MGRDTAMRESRPYCLVDVESAISPCDQSRNSEHFKEKGFSECPVESTSYGCVQEAKPSPTDNFQPKTSMHLLTLLATLCLALVVSAMPRLDRRALSRDDTTDDTPGYSDVDFTATSSQPPTKSKTSKSPVTRTGCAKPPSPADIALAGYHYTPTSTSCIQSYTILGELGKGKFGQVLLAWKDGRYSAIKLMDTSKYNPEEFRLQKKLAEIRGVVHVQEEVDDGTRKGFSMEVATGGDLAGLIKAGLDTTKARELFLQLALALKDIHSKDITIRDIKPDNILVFKEGGRVAFADFGLAKEGQVPYTHPGELKFRSPEVCALRNEVKDFKPADVFALGATLYLMVSPEGASLPLDQTKKRMQFNTLVVERLDELKKRHPAVAALVQAMMATDPKGRPTASEVVQKVQGWKP